MRCEWDNDNKRRSSNRISSLLLNIYLPRGILFYVVVVVRCVHQQHYEDVKVLQKKRRLVPVAIYFMQFVSPRAHP